MSRPEMTEEQFAEAVHNSVHGVVTLYEQVAFMLGELHDLMVDSRQLRAPAGRIRAHRHDYKRAGHEPAVRRLAPWYGYLFAAASEGASIDDSVNEEEFDEEDVEPKRTIELHQGERIIFAKAVIYSPARALPVVPHLLLGSARIGLGPNVKGWDSSASLTLKGRHTRLILLAIREDLQVGVHRTKTRAKKPARSKRLGSDELVHIELTQPPASRPLFDFDGPDAVIEAAETLKSLWKP